MMIETSPIVWWGILHNISCKNFTDTESQRSANRTTHPSNTCFGKLAVAETIGQKVLMAYEANGGSTITEDIGQHVEHVLQNLILKILRNKTTAKKDIASNYELPYFIEAIFYSVSLVCFRESLTISLI